MLSETSIRHRINHILENKGWILNSGHPDRNVFFEHEIPLPFKRKLGRKRPDYSLFQKDSGHYKPIAIIEAKKPGQDLEKALEQGISYAEKIEVPLVFASSNGRYCKTRYVPNGQELKLNGNEVTEFLREKEALEFLKKRNNEVSTIDKKIIKNRKDLISIFANLEKILRDALFTYGLPRFIEFSNILFLKLLSEHKENSIWEDIKGQNDDRIIPYINKVVISDIKKQYGGEVFVPLTIRKPKTLRKIIEILDPLTQM